MTARSIPNASLPWFLTKPDPQIYLTGTYATLDFEIDAPDIGTYGHARVDDNRLVCGYIHYSGDDKFYLVRNELELSQHFDRLLAVDFLIAQNAKYELCWLQRGGFPTHEVLTYDTMIGDYVRSGNRQGFAGRRYGLDLDTICRRYNVPTKSSLVSGLLKSGARAGEIPASLLRYYCRGDVRNTELAAKRQIKLLAGRGLLPVAYMRNLFTPIAADIEMTGMQLDAQVVEQFSARMRKDYDVLITKLDKITGGINMGSPQQVADFLYNELDFEVPKLRGREMRGKPTKKWPDGVPKTGEDAIDLLRPRTARQRTFLKYKSAESKLRKKITGYLNLYDEAIKNRGGHIAGSVNQCVTKTHRLSSSQPNLQNQDRALKPVFCARRPGWAMLNADYSQLEFRVAGLLAKDSQVYEDVASGHDPHSFSACVMADEEYYDLRKSGIDADDERRNRAKPDTFKPLYGGTKGSKAQEKYFAAFRERYKGVTEMQEDWCQEALETKRMTCVTGLITYWPRTRVSQTGFIEESTKINNYQVQMFATADIATIGCTFLWHDMKARQLKSLFVNEVHDNALIESPPEEHDLMRELCKVNMTERIIPFFKAVIGFEIDLPLDVDVKISSNWAWDRNAGKPLFEEVTVNVKSV